MIARSRASRERLAVEPLSRRVTPISTAAARTRLGTGRRRQPMKHFTAGRIPWHDIDERHYRCAIYA